jgi:hypothetical protein
MTEIRDQKKFNAEEEPSATTRRRDRSVYDGAKRFRPLEQEKLKR